MEQNGLFATVLRTLGYTLYTIGSRVFTPTGITGWSHMAIIVTLDGVEYLVDVGFGAYGPTAPIPMLDGQTTYEPVGGVFPERLRIHRDVIPGAARNNYKTWILQSQRDPESNWDSHYCFEKDIEFFDADYKV